MHLFDLERDSALDREVPDAPEVHVMNQFERVRDALQHERRRQLGQARRSLRSAVTGAAALRRDARWRRRPDARRHGDLRGADARARNVTAEPADDQPLAERPVRHDRGAARER